VAAIIAALPRNPTLIIPATPYNAWTAAAKTFQRLGENTGPDESCKAIVRDRFFYGTACQCGYGNSAVVGPW